MNNSVGGGGGGHSPVRGTLERRNSTGSSSSGGERWVCPNDRHLALRAKLRMGWSTGQGGARQEGLSSEETATILQVIQRAEQLEQNEHQRIGRLVGRVHAMREGARGNGTTSCILCGDTLPLLRSATMCQDCRKSVCSKCGHELVTGHDKVWLCKICSETREMWKRSGAWFYRGLPQKLLPQSLGMGRLCKGGRGGLGGNGANTGSATSLPQFGKQQKAPPRRAHSLLSADLSTLLGFGGGEPDIADDEFVRRQRQQQSGRLSSATSPSRSRSVSPAASTSSAGTAHSHTPQYSPRNTANTADQGNRSNTLSSASTTAAAGPGTTFSEIFGGSAIPTWPEDADIRGCNALSLPHIEDQGIVRLESWGVSEKEMESGLVKVEARADSGHKRESNVCDNVPQSNHRGCAVNLGTSVVHGVNGRSPPPYNSECRSELTTSPQPPSLGKAHDARHSHRTTAGPHSPTSPNFVKTPFFGSVPQVNRSSHKLHGNVEPCYGIVNAPTEPEFLPFRAALEQVMIMALLSNGTTSSNDFVGLTSTDTQNNDKKQLQTRHTTQQKEQSNHKQNRQPPLAPPPQQEQTQNPQQEGLRLPSDEEPWPPSALDHRRLSFTAMHSKDSKESNESSVFTSSVDEVSSAGPDSGRDWHDLHQQHDDSQRCSSVSSSVCSSISSTTVHQQRQQQQQQQSNTETPSKRQPQQQQKLGLPKGPTSSSSPRCGSEVVELGSLELTLLYDSHHQSLHCTLHQAQDLRPSSGSGLADPYVKIHLLPGASKSNKLRSRTVPKTLCPEFNETLTYHGMSEDDMMKKTLRMLVMDEDRIGRHFLGEARLALRKLKPHESRRLRVQLQPRMTLGDDASAPAAELGKILLSLRYASARGALTVGVMRCAHLPARDANGFSDPYVKVQLKPDPQKHKLKTAVKWKNLNPEFNEEFAFQVQRNELPKRQLDVRVYDKDVGRTDDFIGGLVLSHDSRGPELRHWYDVIQYPDRRHDRWHSLRPMHSC